MEKNVWKPIQIIVAIIEIPLIILSMFNFLKEELVWGILYALLVLIVIIVYYLSRKFKQSSYILYNMYKHKKAYIVKIKSVILDLSQSGKYRLTHETKIKSLTNFTSGIYQSYTDLGNADKDPRNNIVFDTPGFGIGQVRTDMGWTHFTVIPQKPLSLGEEKSFKYHIEFENTDTCLGLKVNEFPTEELSLTAILPANVKNVRYQVKRAASALQFEKDETMKANIAEYNKSIKHPIRGYIYIISWEFV